MGSLGNSVVFDDYYRLPQRFKLIIKDKDGIDTLHTYNGFSDNPDIDNDINLVSLDCARGMQQTGSFDLVFEDSDRVIDIDKVNKGNIVIIQAGKTEADAKNLLYGISYDFGGKRDHSYLTWTMSGKGSAAILQHTYVNYIKMAPSESLRTGEQVFKKDPNFQVHKLFRTLFEDRLIYPLDRKSLVQRGNFSLTKVSDKITEIYPSIIHPLAVAGSVANTLADAVGAQWNVNENNEVVFDYPSALSTGIVIRDRLSTDINGNFIDNGDYTAYPIGKVSFNTSIDPSSGFANVLFGTAELVNIISGEAGSKAFESLYNKDLAQMFIPGSAALRDLTFVLSKTGAGTDAPDPAIKKLFGFVAEDNPEGLTHKPGNTQDKIVATFSIPVSEISEQPTPISKIDLKFNRNVKFEIDKEHWIVLQEIGNGEDNTVRWWHDADDFTESEAAPYPNRLIRWSGRRLLPKGRSDGDTFSFRRWIVSSHGPVFSHAFLSGNKILTQARNVLSIARWTRTFPVEAKVDAPWIKHAVTMSQYLNTLVHITGQPPVEFDTMLTTIPNILYTPGATVQVVDDLLGFPESRNFLGQVTEDHYWVDADDLAIGNYTCEVNVRGYESPLDFHSDATDPLLED